MTLTSEPIIPALEGFPQATKFDRLLKRYIENLSTKKRDKALIPSSRAQIIKAVLAGSDGTAVVSAQFRFWVQKMFEFEPESGFIYHKGKAVANWEKIFKILTSAHQRCQHGGRDKTFEQVKKLYSWVPKKLVRDFVMICPSCQWRRSLRKPDNDLQTANTLPTPGVFPVLPWRADAPGSTRVRGPGRPLVPTELGTLGGGMDGAMYGLRQAYGAEP
ncbi:hypothetical protein ACJ73_01669 [Blastomyces percursus]|uniref:Integrase zinc-binding domain-containing protein n=1 Tax=Blastomyces percursus TaxID=1658174 RepID=A0A1J9QFR8_9EURO|nr:hypothetical protein ACJ73_01669 [Blastomyces percursus]